MLRGGANAHQEIAVPATGEYFLRIGVHDISSDRVGAIESTHRRSRQMLCQPAPP